MLAFAMHLFEIGATKVELHPDGEHGKRFRIRDWLSDHGYSFETAIGTTSYGGKYTQNERTLVVSLKPGNGDVVADINGKTVVAECKGGVINSKHSGVASRLRRGLCEAIGLLFVRDAERERHIAVVPDALPTRRLAEKMAKRARRANIEIALVGATGEISFVHA
ncbi:MAG: hypothetical protein ABSC92_16360 [Rhizomicrobium sp.]